MSDDALRDLDRLLDEAAELKRSCLHRDDARFSVWHERARDLVAQHAAKRLPAFNEIRFASDYFLSQPPQKREAINDRIAFTADMDEADLLLRGIGERLLKDMEKRRLHATPPVAGGESGYGLAERARSLIAGPEFSARDRETILDEMRRVEAALARPEPDWDGVKRVVKFLLDTDRALALELVPAILRRAGVKK